MPPVHLAREQSLYTQFANHALRAQQQQQARLQEQMATGKSVNRASDDAVAYGQARQMETLSNRFGQYQESIQSSRGWLNQTQSELEQLSERLMEAHETAIRALNDSWSAAEREAMANKLEALKEEVIAHLNAQHGGEYLFGGTRTSEAPFDAEGNPPVDGNGDPDYGLIEGVRRRQIGPPTNDDPALDSNRYRINIPGSELHQVAGASYEENPGEVISIVDALQNMADLLRGDENDIPAGFLPDPPPAQLPDPSEFFEEAIGHLEQARDHVINKASEAGRMAERLSTADAQLREATLEVERRRSEVEDADLMELFMEMQKSQASMQAGLQVTASILQTSLLDYLR